MKSKSHHHKADRAVSEVVGAILVFGLLILIVSMFQALGVPAANEEVEFQHNLNVQEDMRDLFGVISQTGVDERKSVKVATGTRYPSRFILLNPPDPAGRILTESLQGDFILDNATADGEAGDFLDGSATHYSSKAIVYKPQYNEFKNSPNTIIAPGVLYNRFGSSDIVLASRLINQRTVTVFIINGSLSEEGFSSSVDVNMLSGPARTVSVTNEGNEPITLTVPSKLEVSTWENDILAKKQYVQNVEQVPGRDQVKITLQRNVTYNLQLVKVGVGNHQSESNATYIADIEGDNSTLAEHSRRTVTFQVRDRFNNPISGETVHVGVDTGKILKGGSHQGYDSDDTVEYRTNENGEVSIVYEAPSTITNPSQANIRASIEFDDLEGNDPQWSSSTENASITLQLLNSTEEDQSKPLFNPFSGVVIEKALITDECPNPDSSCEVEITFKNKGNITRTITDIRYVFFGGDEQGQSSGNPNDVLRVWDGSIGSSPKADLGGDYVDVDKFDFTIEPGNTTKVTLRFYENSAGTDERNLDPKEWFVIDVLIDDSRRDTYFVDPGD